jgi:hypothetical protein
LQAGVGPQYCTKMENEERGTIETIKNEKQRKK